MKPLLLILSILLLSCKGTSQEKNTILKTSHQINFTDLFNEGTIIKFTPKDLNKNEPEIREFKEKLKSFNEITNLENFDVNELSILINNDTFFDAQY